MSETNPPADHVFVEDENVSRPVEENIKSRATWTRFLFMMLSYVLVSLASLVGTVVVVLGFLWVLFTGEVNKDLRNVGQSIAAYVFQNISYLTFNTDEKPFPFGSKWPSFSEED